MIKKGLLNRIHRFLWKLKVTCYENVRCLKNRRILADNIKFKNCAKNKRCFVIGNGPSLTLADLNMLHLNKEVCFASNKIYQLFDETEWRPDFFATCDSILYKNNCDIINKLELVKFFPLDILSKENIKHGEVHAFSRVPFQLFRKKPHFQPELTKRLCEGGTITYFLLQIAVYMGFKEIYLLGCDFNFSYGIDVNGNYFENSKVINHFKDDGKKLDTMPNLQYNLWAYESAQDYCRSHDVKIFNATRGGKLEVFPRRSFDELF